MFLRRYHFFDYSKKATPEFKTQLEGAVAAHDRATDAITYTPYADEFVNLVMGVLVAVFSKIEQDKNDHRYSTAIIALGGCVTIIGALTTMIKLICSNVANTAQEDSDKLIAFGMRNGYFNTHPDANDQDPDKITDIYTDAQKYRIYRRS